MGDRQHHPVGHRRLRIEAADLAGPSRIDHLVCVQPPLPDPNAGRLCRKAQAGLAFRQGRAVPQPDLSGRSDVLYAAPIGLREDDDCRRRDHEQHDADGVRHTEESEAEPGLDHHEPGQRPAHGDRRRPCAPAGEDGRGEHRREHQGKGNDPRNDQFDRQAEQRGGGHDGERNHRLPRVTPQGADLVRLRR